MASRTIEHACIICGKVRTVKLNYGKPRNLICHVCANKKRAKEHSGENSPLWKGGIYKLPHYFRTYGQRFPEKIRIIKQKFKNNNPLHIIWSGMKQRCYNPNLSQYKYYGGRGITVCEEWLDYKTFEEWALKNGWQPGLTIDRIDNDENYEPSNCQFLTRSENSKKMMAERRKHKWN